MTDTTFNLVDELDRRRLTDPGVPELPNVPGIAVPAPLAQAYEAYDAAYGAWQEAIDAVTDAEEDHAIAIASRRSQIRAAAVAVEQGRPAPKLAKLPTQQEHEDQQMIRLGVVDIKAAAVGRAVAKVKTEFAKAAPGFVEPCAEFYPVAAREALDALGKAKQAYSTALAALEEVVRARTLAALGPGALTATRSRYGDVTWAVRAAITSGKGNSWGEPDVDQLLDTATDRAAWLGGADPMATDGQVNHIGGSGTTFVPGNLTYRAAANVYHVEPGKRIG